MIFFVFHLENIKIICTLWRFLRYMFFVYGEITHYRGLVDGAKRGQ